MTRSAYAPEVDSLMVAHAAVELAGRRKLRALLDAAGQGRTQRDMASNLRVSQAAVHKMLVKARRIRDLGIVTPREIALQYAAGEIPHGEMIVKLAGFSYATPRVLDPDNPLPEQIVVGNWGEVEAAALDGLISDEDVDSIIARRAG